MNEIASNGRMIESTFLVSKPKPPAVMTAYDQVSAKAFQNNMRRRIFKHNMVQ